MDLVSQLVSQLGISDDQAQGGLGVLLQAAKDKLPLDQFSQIADAIPGANQFLDAAPAAEEAATEESSGGIMGALGGIASSLGMGETLSNATGLLGMLSSFQKLGLDMSMLQKFVPMVISYIQENAGDGVASLVKSFTGGEE